MAKIDELLKELCPDGVEWKTFSDCCSYIRGITYNKSQESKSDDGVKVLRANNITLSNNSLNFADVKVVDNSVKIKDSQWLKQSDILICAGSGSKEHIGKVAFVPNDLHYTFGGFMGVIRSKCFVLQSYLFHLLKSTIFSDYLNAALNSSTINNLSASIMSNFSFPLPPLPIQQHIVEVLDTFTDAISNLEEELALREKQLEYYREQLLSFDDQNVKWSSIKDCISSLSTGVNPRQHFVLNSEGSSYNYITGKNISNNKIDISSGADKINAQALSLINKRAKLENDMLLFASTGTGTVGRMAYVEHYDNSWTVSETLYVIKVKQLIYTKFLMHVLNAWHIKQYIGKISKGSVPHLKMSDLLNVFIPVPSLERQQEIVEILDTFEAMIANIKEEIELRTKQNEYYREKLLSFGK